MYESAEIAKAIKKVAKSKNILLKDNLGLNKNTMTNLYSGSMISAGSLGKIADYLDCPMDYLMGRTDEP